MASFSDFLHLLLYPGLAALVILGWALVLWGLGAWTPAEVKVWNRIAAGRGYQSQDNPAARLLLRIPGVAKALGETNLQKMLWIAGREQTPLQFWSQTVGISLGALVVLMALDGWTKVSGGNWALPPELLILLSLSLIPISVLGLRQNVAKKRGTVNRNLGDMLTYLSVVAGARGITVPNAARLLSKCLKDDSLAVIIADEQWRKLMPPARSTTDLYRKIGENYDIEMFIRVSDALTQMEKGMLAEDVFMRLANADYNARILDARQKAAKAEVKIVIPIALMLLPLLAMLLIPIFLSTAGALG